MLNTYSHADAVKELVLEVLKYIRTNKAKFKTETFSVHLNTDEESYRRGTVHVPTGIVSIFHSNTYQTIASSDTVLEFSRFWDCIIEEGCHNTELGVSMRFVDKYCNFIHCFHETMKQEFNKSELSDLFELETTALGFTLKKGSITKFKLPTVYEIADSRNTVSRYTDLKKAIYIPLDSLNVKATKPESISLEKCDLGSYFFVAKPENDSNFVLLDADGNLLDSNVPENTNLVVIIGELFIYFHSESIDQQTLLGLKLVKGNNVFDLQNICSEFANCISQNLINLRKNSQIILKNNATTLPFGDSLFFWKDNTLYFYSLSTDKLCEIANYPAESAVLTQEDAGIISVLLENKSEQKRLYFDDKGNILLPIFEAITG